MQKEVLEGLSLFWHEQCMQSRVQVAGKRGKRHMHLSVTLMPHFNLIWSWRGTDLKGIYSGEQSSQRDHATLLTKRKLSLSPNPLRHDPHHHCFLGPSFPSPAMQAVPRSATNDQSQQPTFPLISCHCTQFLCHPHSPFPSPAAFFFLTLQAPTNSLTSTPCSISHSMHPSFHDFKSITTLASLHGRSHCMEVYEGLYPALLSHQR